MVHSSQLRRCSGSSWSTRTSTPAIGPVGSPDRNRPPPRPAVLRRRARRTRSSPGRGRPRARRSRPAAGRSGAAAGRRMRTRVDGSRVDPVPIRFTGLEERRFFRLFDSFDRTSILSGTGRIDCTYRPCWNMSINGPGGKIVTSRSTKIKSVLFATALTAATVVSGVANQAPAAAAQLTAHAARRRHGRGLEPRKPAGGQRQRHPQRNGVGQARRDAGPHRQGQGRRASRRSGSRSPT